MKMRNIVLFFLVLFGVPKEGLSQEQSPLFSVRTGYGWHYYQNWHDADPYEWDFRFSTAENRATWSASLAFVPIKQLHIGMGVMHTALPLAFAFADNITLYNFYVGYQFDFGQRFYAMPTLKSGFTEGTLIDRFNEFDKYEWTGGIDMDFGVKVFPWLAASYSPGMLYFDEKVINQNNRARFWHINSIFQHHTFGIRYFLLRTPKSKKDTG